MISVRVCGLLMMFAPKWATNKLADKVAERLTAPRAGGNTQT